ncbi:MAG: histidine phosphatase family protein, partial [Spirochaetia bacterium]|nr:histidine phosphatase family protein [Spirochaetia bacterium]
MHIYLIRHGETDWNTKLLFQGHSNTSLNKNGIRQAVCMGKELKDVRIDALISSDLNRAKETALEIRKLSNFRYKISVDRDLRERDYGNLEGKEYDLYHSQKKGFTGEKDREFFARV